MRVIPKETSQISPLTSAKRMKPKFLFLGIESNELNPMYTQIGAAMHSKTLTIASSMGNDVIPVRS